MSRTIKQAMDAKQKGFLIKNSIFLPFHLELLSVWIGKDMSLVSKPDVITDFSDKKGDLHIREGENYTNLIFVNHKELKREYGNYKGHIILFCTEKGDDIFDKTRRHYIKLSFHDDTNNVYMELIDDPFEL
ncbi:MAG: hypothetical protein HOD43_14550 [Candidatus Marinimicrobia bacterium]|jgi:hypothetical protein|nr:hypothetical protein [Candidatus Neomarinimicrobiota bacterium]MBT3631974.1 hypothetical protein [Candidatus Neomarinimicrobiota bacterium]MBT3824560.1 hypothetical protein [Candidatus Neomarinimicrobiota bacterium]MBT4130265.1 hypothetical protein [Candidatus Neomarinimicrobiota bacterium]MBT4297016.1 hypothetical protein [Candidatus Neomarinimicrobiota bacterium]